MQLELLVRLCLALVYGAAALGKLRDPRGAHSLIEGFDLDARLAPAVRSLPFVELSVAGGLLFGVTSRGAAIASIGLLVLFSVFILRNLHHGRIADCNCFGRLNASKAGWQSLVRNGLFASGSGLVALSSGQPALWPAMRDSALAVSKLGSTGAELALAVTVIAVIGFLLRDKLATPAWRGLGGIQAEGGAAVGTQTAQSGPYGLPAGLTTLDGQVSTTRPGQTAADRTILAFIDPECVPCRTVLPGLHRWWDSVTTGGLFIVTRGSVEINRQLMAEFPSSRVVIDTEFGLAERYGVPGTPAAVVLAGEDFRVETVVVGATAIEALLRQSSEAVEAPRRLPKWLRRGRTQRFMPGRGFGQSSRAAALTRREVFAAAGAGAGLALATTTPGRVLAAWGKSEHGRPEGNTARGKGGAVLCPSCGRCTTCEMVPATKSTPAKLACRPCKQKCTARKLCVGYANQFGPYQRINAYLRSHGFTQNGVSNAVGLQEKGQLVLLASYTHFKSQSPKGPKAVLNYGLTNSGESATAAIFNSQGKITSVVSTNPAGQLVMGELPAHPKLTWAPELGAAGLDNHAEGPRSEAISAVYSCSQVCGAEWGYMLFALSPLLAATFYADAAAVGFAFTSFLLSQAISTSNASPLVKNVVGYSLTAALNAADMMTLGPALLKKLGGQLICKGICSLKLQACCNYTGACFASDAVCEHHCPGGLKHPMAHCDVYINGVKVSQVI